MNSHLLFTLNGVCYGVATGAVREIGWLPELTPAAEVPDHIAGVVNLHGRIEPVMDLGRRLGHPPLRYQLSDNLVMLQADGVSMGVIVSEARDVVDIPPAAVTAPPPQSDVSPGGSGFIAGYARVGAEIVALLDVPRLLHEPALPVSGAGNNSSGCFHPDTSEAERAVFRDRAQRQMQVPDGTGDAERTPLSVIRLAGEHFAVGLEMVREFCHLHRVIDIPCCPPHIVGNMNLRGDILTLVDIRHLLHLPQGDPAAEVMVIESEDLCIGVPVDRVLEVIYLRPDDIAPLPAAAHEEKHEYCRGAACYGAEMVSILDMQKILSQGGLAVEEEV